MRYKSQIRVKTYLNMYKIAGSSMISWARP